MGEIAAALNERPALLAQRKALVEACEALVRGQANVHRMDNDERWWCRFCHASGFALDDITHTTNCPMYLARAAVALVRGEDVDRDTLPFQAVGSDNWRDGKAHAILFGDFTEGQVFNVHLPDENTKALVHWLNSLWSSSVLYGGG